MTPRNQQNQVNTDSIFYVHPSEGPNSVIVTPLLTGSNYLAWSRSMQRALGAKNKLVFIDGSIPIPDLEDLNRDAILFFQGPQIDRIRIASLRSSCWADGLIASVN